MPPGRPTNVGSRCRAWTRNGLCGFLVFASGLGFVVAGADKGSEADNSASSIVEARRAAFEEAARQAGSPEELIALKDAILKRYPEPEPPAPAEEVQVPDTDRLTGPAKAVIEVSKALAGIQKNAGSPEEMIRQKAEYLEANAEKLAEIDVSPRGPSSRLNRLPSTFGSCPPRYRSSRC